jgi:hypothetical protein
VNFPNCKQPSIVFGGGAIVILILACTLASFRPQASPSPSEPLAKSTLAQPASSAPKALPLADDAPPTPPRPGVYNHETAFSSGIPVTAPQPAARVEIDSTQPGNQMNFHGKAISVAETLPDDAGNGRELAVDITPTQKTTAEKSNDMPEPPALPMDEEQFRAKWGWATTDQVKAAALEENPPQER